MQRSVCINIHWYALLSKARSVGFKTENVFNFTLWNFWSYRLSHWILVYVSNIPLNYKGSVTEDILVLFVRELWEIIAKTAPCSVGVLAKSGGCWTPKHHCLKLLNLSWRFQFLNWIMAQLLSLKLNTRELTAVPEETCLCRMWSYLFSQCACAVF